MARRIEKVEYFCTDRQANSELKSWIEDSEDWINYTYTSKKFEYFNPEIIFEVYDYFYGNYPEFSKEVEKFRIAMCDKIIAEESSVSGKWVRIEAKAGDVEIIGYIKCLGRCEFNVFMSRRKA